MLCLYKHLTNINTHETITLFSATINCKIRVIIHCHNEQKITPPKAKTTRQSETPLFRGHLEQSFIWLFKRAGLYSILGNFHTFYNDFHSSRAVFGWGEFSRTLFESGLFTLSRLEILQKLHADSQEYQVVFYMAPQESGIVLYFRQFSHLLQWFSFFLSGFWLEEIFTYSL